MNRAKLDKNIKDAVWRKYTNSLDWHCPICEHEIKYHTCHIAHIIAVANGGLTNINNLIPTCSACNLGMGKRNLYEYKNVYDTIIRPSSHRICDEKDKATVYDIKRTPQVLDMMNDIILHCSYFQDNQRKDKRYNDKRKYKNKYWPMCQLKNYYKIIINLAQTQWIYDNWINIFNKRNIVIWIYNNDDKQYYPTDIDEFYKDLDEYLAHYFENVD